MLKNRYLTPYIIEDLLEKMVFVGGPRQVGKTTLARELVAGHFNGSGYFNWDSRADRKRIMASDWPGSAELIILDELHKYRKWKSFIKGEYDTLKERFRFLVTGSARLDIYRKGGDSMLGRYHYYRLHPFSFAEINGKNDVPVIFGELPVGMSEKNDAFLSMERFGGFPEPFLKQNSRVLRRWHREKHERMFREDIRDIEMIKDISGMRLFADILPERVGSLFSLNSIREDVEVSHRAVSNWLEILEAFYYCFRIYPYAGKNYRSLKKASKLYLWDWSEINDGAVRFENCIAAHLLKLVNFLEDYEGHNARLFFLRNAEKKEVDFLVAIDNKPWFCVEVKLNDTNISPNLSYFKKKLNIPFAYQVVKKSGVDRLINKSGDYIRVVSADAFLSALI